MNEFKRNRADAYRMAFWSLIRRFAIADLSDILDELALICKVCDMDEEETLSILKETTSHYLKIKEAL